MEIVLILLLVIVIVALVVYVLLLKAKESTRVSAFAQKQFQDWRESDLESARKQQAEIAQREASVHLARWKTDYEQSIRQEAVKKSHDVVSGKVTEQLIPFLPNFRYNPRDARFIGSPIDFLVFDGLSAGEVKQIVFIEVKTGSSGLNTREKQVRSIVDARTIKWEELRVDREPVLRSGSRISPTPGPDHTSLSARGYSMTNSYQVGEQISHKTFGNGRVIAVQHNKIEVQFREGIKYLAHKS